MRKPVTDDPNSSDKDKYQRGARSRPAQNRATSRPATADNKPQAKRSLLANHTTDKTLDLTSKIDDLTVNDLMLLANQAPDLYREVIKNEANRRRLAWAGLTTYILGHLSGLAALFMLILVAWHDIDFDHPTQATSIICSGAVSIVAVFVTGKLVKRKSSGTGSDNS